MLLILDHFFSTTGLFRTSAVLRENNFSKGGRNIESFGPVADHFLSFSLFNFLQIWYHSLPHPFLISNSCTLIKFNVNTKFGSWWSYCCSCYIFNFNFLGAISDVLVGTLILLLLIPFWISSFLSIYNYFKLHLSSLLYTIHFL